MFQHMKICLSDLPHLEHSPQQPSNLTTLHHYLMFVEHDDSLLDDNTLHARMENHSPEEHPVAHHLTSAEEEEEDEEDEDLEEHFPTSLLNDDVWMEEPVPDRHLCIHEHSQHSLCPIPLPIQLGSATPHSGLCTSVNGPQQHFQLPRCDNNCQ